ncbi:MAG: adenosylcobinamide-GDP ribazoletransferase [Oscillospiraceae bacterium]|nr:adenosylcobinamide-GDP ribazoletransferase [Oscillospiraceae bacterium]
MKRIFRAFYMTLGMFCAIPLPWLIWDDDCVILMMPCFPFVGLVIGGIWWLAAKLLLLSTIHTALSAAILTLVMLSAAGFIHLDGYMDTSDAVLSRRDHEEKIRILKDPHTGSFSVIMVALLFLFQYAATFAFLDKGTHALLLILIAVISRCGSAYTTLVLTPAPHSSNVNMYRKVSIKLLYKSIGPLITILSTVIAFYIAGIGGVIVCAAAVLGYGAAMAYVYIDLKGVSGDLAGFALVISELCGLIALAII